eukprot:scaffold136170_cov45-Tisochrysis_lutea.AAC.3
MSYAAHRTKDQTDGERDAGREWTIDEPNCEDPHQIVTNACTPHVLTPRKLPLPIQSRHVRVKTQAIVPSATNRPTRYKLKEAARALRELRMARTRMDERIVASAANSAQVAQITRLASVGGVTLRSWASVALGRSSEPFNEEYKI